jgi:hypothetical protein
MTNNSAMLLHHCWWCWGRTEIHQDQQHFHEVLPLLRTKICQRMHAHLFHSCSAFVGYFILPFRVVAKHAIEIFVHRHGFLFGSGWWFVPLLPLSTYRAATSYVTTTLSIKQLQTSRWDNRHSFSWLWGVLCCDSGQLHSHHFRWRPVLRLAYLSRVLQDTNILDPTISAYGMYAMETGCALVRMRNSCVSCIDIDVGFYFTILHSHAIRDEDALSWTMAAV